jgi:hypothetical protein
VSAPLVATYLVANNATVTALIPLAMVQITQPYTDTILLVPTVAVSGTTLTVNIKKMTVDAGPDLEYADAVTADVVGVNVIAFADVE